jgi:nucleotide-binding universal stress UspA family protein
MAALAMARDFASALGAVLHVLHVVDEPFHHAWTHFAPAPELVDMLKDSEAQARARLAAAVPAHDVAGGKVVIDAVWGDPKDEILRYAEAHGADLIVCGTHGRRGWDRALLGSVAERLVRLARCPVLTVPCGPQAAAGPA